MKSQTYYLLLFVAFGFNNICAQTKDSLAGKAIQAAADKFPFTRLLNAEARYDAPYDYGAKMPGTSLPDGRVTQLYQYRLSANINFVKTRKWVVGTGLFYNYIHAETQSNTTVYGNGAEDIHYFAAAVNAMHFSKLFGKTAIYTASAIPTGGSDGFERITGLVTATIVLKANAKTKMTIGVAGVIDPSSLIPAFLIFSYEHHFNNGWVADVILPQRLLMKKDMFKDGRLSLGTELGNTTFYLNNFNGVKKTYMFSQIEIMSGATYEHCFLKNFIGTLKTGFKYIPTGRITEINEKFNDYVFSATPKGNFYINLGISYNP